MIRVHDLRCLGRDAEIICVEQVDAVQVAPLLEVFTVTRHPRVVVGPVLGESSNGLASLLEVLPERTIAISVRKPAGHTDDGNRLRDRVQTGDESLGPGGFQPLGLDLRQQVPQQVLAPRYRGGHERSPVSWNAAVSSLSPNSASTSRSSSPTVAPASEESELGCVEPVCCSTKPASDSTVT